MRTRAAVPAGKRGHPSDRPKPTTIFYEEAARAFPEKRMRKDMTDGDPDKEENFYILKHTSCPTVLTENFFMDTKDDCKLIFSGSGRQRVADMHVAAIVRCIEYHNNK